MKLSWTLSTYIGRIVLYHILVTLGVLLAIGGFADLVELIRRTAGKPNVGFTLALEMSLMRLPYLAEQLLPYAMLIGAMLALAKLTRTQELIVVRSAGVSVWQFLLPGALLGFVMGIVVVALFDPISSAMLARYERLESRYISGNASLLTVSPSGLWLRQVETGNAQLNAQPVQEYILHADRIEQVGMIFHEVTIYAYADDFRFIGRIDSKTAVLNKGFWLLENVTVAAAGKQPEAVGRMELPTELNITQIQDSFADPRTLSFWQLSGFIHTLEQAGFSALRHRIHWHEQLTQPVTFAAMILLAALFSMRLSRRGKVAVMLFAGIITGFLINFMTQLFHAFGASGNLPVFLAAWGPPFLVLLSGTALLLHFEDG